MAEIETLEDIVVNEDPVAQMSVLPLATRMRMASEDDKLLRPKYYHLDEALRISYDDIMSKQTDTQLAYKRGVEAKATSDTGDIIRATVTNYIINAMNKPEKLVLAIGDVMTAAGSSVGKEWANWANESINDFVENNYISQSAGDPETWAAKITGGVLSALEYMGIGMISSPLANVSMGVDILGEATKNDIDRYIAETGDKSLTNYKADWRDVGVNFLNAGIQLYIEDKLGLGKVLKAKTHGADEFLSGFLQEFLQGETGDISEAIKGNIEWRDVLKNVISNAKDGVVGAFLQGPLGLAAHHHYASAAERQMSGFFVKNGMEEKAAQQKAHKLRLQLEKEIAPLVIKQDKEIYDLVGQKGAVWGSVYDVAYNGVRFTDQTGMSEAELDSMATEVANRLATQVLDSVVKNGTDLSDVRIGFNPVDQSVYVNDKKTLDIKQAVKEIEELNAEPAATKEDVKEAIAEEKKAEEKKVAEAQQPKSAIDPKAPFNKTKEKSPTFKWLQKGLEDGTIKLSKAEQIRYAMLLRDKVNNKPTTNRQMDLFANKMLEKYAPVEVQEQISIPVAQAVSKLPVKPVEQDRSRWKEGEKERQHVKRLEEETGADLSKYKKDSPERIKAEQEEALRLARQNGVEYVQKVLTGEIKTDIIDGAWVMAIDTLASEGNREAILLLNSDEFGNKIVALSESARQLASWKNMLKETSVSILDAKKALETNITKVVGEEKAKKNISTMKASLQSAVSETLNSKELEQKADSFLDSKVC